MAGKLPEPLSRWTLAVTLVPVLLDAIHFLTWESMHEAFVGLLQTASPAAGWLVLGIYALHVASLGLLRLLEPSVALETVVLRVQDERTGAWRRQKTTWPEQLLAVPSFGFGIIMILGTIMAMMDAERNMTASDGTGATIMLLGVALFILQLTLRFGDNARWGPAQPAYLATLIPIVLIGEVTLSFSSALLSVLFGADASGPVIEDPSVAWSFILMTPIYLLFFAAPRFTFMTKSFTWPSFLSGLALTLYAVWRFVSANPVV